MDATAQQQLRDRLESARTYMQAAVAGLTDAQAAQKPAPERWSALDVLEHVTTVEYRFQGWVNDAKPLDAASYDDGKITDLTTRMSNRESKRQAPEAVHPTGKFPTLAAALEAFNEARAKTLALVAERGENLDQIQTHHAFFGDLTGAEVLHLLAAHGSRHADQIKETRSQIGA